MFKLNSDFLKDFARREVNWGPTGYIVYKRTYALPVGDRTEEWYETCARVINGMYQVQEDHCNKYCLPWDSAKAQRSAQEAYRRMFEFKWSPPGRGLAKMGTEYVKKHGAACLNNCAMVTTKGYDAANFHVPFAFLMDCSMLGVGVGFDVGGAGSLVVQAPEFTGERVIGDSREAQVDIVSALLRGYFTGSVFPSVCDYSQIRPKGSPIAGFGGKASGPLPLRQLLADIRAILEPLQGLQITATAIVDLMNAIGKMVVSGGVRRTAEIALGPATEEFLALKDPETNQERLNNWGWCSNNSVVIPHHGAVEDYSPYTQRMTNNGEPGLFWLGHAQTWGRGVDKFTTSNKTDNFAVGTNPCGEQTLEDHELCTLVETYPSNHDSLKDWRRTLKFAYLYGKTVTLLPTHNPRINTVMMKNRRIGCSMSGVVDAINKFGYTKFRSNLDRAYYRLQQVDVKYSNWLGIPRSIKTTSIKPSGTISKLCGVSEGCHWPYAEYYYQVIRFSEDSPYVQPCKDAGYSVYDLPNEPNTVAVYFPVRAPNFDRAEADVSLWEKLALAELLQSYWADNQVSCTVTFQPEEADQLARAIEHFAPNLKGISCLPSKDHGFEHAPKQPITKEEYELAMKNLKPLDLTGSVRDSEEKFCDGEACTI